MDVVVYVPEQMTAETPEDHAAGGCMDDVEAVVEMMRVAVETPRDA